jgi:hypothetical protein
MTLQRILWNVSETFDTIKLGRGLTHVSQIYHGVGGFYSDLAYIVARRAVTTQPLRDKQMYQSRF